MLKKKPFVLAYILVDGCKIAMPNELEGFKTRNSEFNITAKIVWPDKKDRRGMIIDVCFEPADGSKSRPTNPENQ